MDNKIVEIEKSTPVPRELTVDQLITNIKKVDDVYNKIMKKDTHYGVIQGCGDKPALLKAGAEKLTQLFMLSPRLTIDEKDLGNGHREYNFKVELYHRHTNEFWGEGNAVCSTMESKFRYRYDFKNTGKPVPQEYWENRDSALLGGSQYSTKKIDGKWMICTKEKIENPDIADTYNTVKKIGKKRALVDATITATGS